MLEIKCWKFGRTRANGQSYLEGCALCAEIEESLRVVCIRERYDGLDLGFEVCIDIRLRLVIILVVRLHYT